MEPAVVNVDGDVGWGRKIGGIAGGHATLLLPLSTVHARASFQYCRL